MEPESPPQPPADKPSTQRRFLDHTAVRVAELGLTLLSIFLAVIFYIRSQIVKAPYYYVDPIRSILVNRELEVGQKLTVLFEGKPTQNGDISVLRCYFWDAGRASIHDADVLRQIRVVLDAGNQIVDASIIRQSRPDIMQLKVTPEKGADGANTNAATISFKILEQDDAVAMQVLYAGGPSAGVSFSGAIEGAKIQRLPRPLDAFRDSSSGETELRKSANETFLALLLFPPVLPVLVAGSILLTDRKEAREMLRWVYGSKRFWFSLPVWMALVFAAYYYLFYFYPSIPRSVL